MQMIRTVALTMLMACGGPALRNVPQPNANVVAGAAAAFAGAASLAGRTPESNKPPAEDRPIKSGPTVPADVLDRLDRVQP
jgi:hypothetical protein